MSGRRRTLGLLFVLCVALFAAILMIRHGGTVFSESRRPDLPPSSSSLCFQLQEDDWLRFLVPPGQTRVKVLSNATTSLPVRELETENLLYSFDYRLLDADENIVHEGRYFVRSAAESYRDPETGAVYPSHFWGRLGDVALSTRSVVLNLRQFPVAVAEVQLRRGEVSAAVADVFVRLYFNEKPASYKFRYLWQRLPPLARERLTRGNVYGGDLLTERETENLLRNRWSGLAPEGVTGEDFHADRLFAVRLPPEQKLRESLMPRGLVVRRDEIGVVLLHADSGCTQLEFHAAEGQFRGGAVHLSFYDEAGGDPVYRRVELFDPITTLEEEFPAGVVELVPSIDVVVRAFTRAAPAPIEVTPSTISRPAYVVETERGVTFGLERYDVSPLPFRVEVRRLLDAGGSADSPELEYELIDAGGRILQRGAVSVQAPRSWHDRLRASFDHAAVSDPMRLHFWIPPGVARLSLRCEETGLLVAGAAGLPGVPRMVRVGRVPQVTGQRSWFPLRPEGYEGFVERGHEVFIRVQDRPPRPAIEQKAEYVTVTPLEDRLAFQLLIPAADDRDREDAGSRSAWSALECGVVDDVYFPPRPGASRTTARLLVVADRQTNALLECQIDGATVVRQEIRGSTHLLELPPVSPGWKELLLQSEAPLEVFMNGAMPSDSRSSHVVSAYQLDDRELTLAVRKSSFEREAIFVQVFAHGTHADPLRLHSSIKGFSRESGVYGSWTHIRKVFEVWPDATRSFPVLWSDGRRVVGGERLAIALGSDMPPGLYEIVLRSETHDDACLVRVSHRLAEARGGARFFTEDSLPDPDDDEE